MYNKIKFIAIMAVAAIIAFSCENESVDAVYDGDEAGQLAYNDSKAFARLALEECDTCCGPGDDVISGDTVDAADVGLYCPWDPIPYDFCGNDNPQIQFEGQFNSFVRGLNGWNIAYIDTATNNNWSVIVDEIIDDDQYWWHRAKSEPDTCNFTPCNVMGINDPQDVDDAFEYGEGYYTYNSTAREITPFRDLIVWKNCDLTGAWDSCGLYDICTATVAYRLSIDSIAAVPIPMGGPPTSFTSTISFSWECLTVTECEE